MNREVRILETFPSFRKFNFSKNFKLPFENYGYSSQTSSVKLLPTASINMFETIWSFSKPFSELFFVVLLKKLLQTTVSSAAFSNIEGFLNLRLIFLLKYTYHRKVLSHKNFVILKLHNYFYIMLQFRLSIIMNPFGP